VRERGREREREREKDERRDAYNVKEEGGLWFIKRAESHNYYLLACF